MRNTLNLNVVKNIFKNNGLTLLDDKYINKKTDMLAKTFDGYLVNTSIEKLENNRKPYIFGYNNINTIYNIKKWLAINKLNFELKSREFISADKVKLEFHCLKHNRDFHITWNNFKKRTRCPECGRESFSKKKRVSFTKIAEKFSHEGLTIINEEREYIESRSPLIAKTEQGYTVCISWSNLSKGQSYSIFHARNPYTIENIKLWIKNNTSGYKLLPSVYVNNEEKINFRCPSDHEFSSSWNNFFGGRRCPICKDSRGEEVIRKFLVERNINYIREYRFYECRNIRPLPYDYAILDDKQNIKLLVEYDGELHFKTVDFFGGDKQFNYRKRNDEIKNIFCQKNKLQLLRISYWEFNNIEKILEKKLSELGLIHNEIKIHKVS